MRSLHSKLSSIKLASKFTEASVVFPKKWKIMPFYCPPFPVIVFQACYMDQTSKGQGRMHHPGQTPTQLFSHYLNQLWYPWPDVPDVWTTGTKVWRIPVTAFTCSLLLFFAMNPLSGKMRMTVAIPARADGPSCWEKEKGYDCFKFFFFFSYSVGPHLCMNWMLCKNTAFQHTCQRKKRQSAISIGASHTALKYTTKSMSFWVSAETRFTISPTVQVLLAELFITKDWIANKRDRVVYSVI